MASWKKAGQGASDSILAGREHGAGVCASVPIACGHWEDEHGLLRGNHHPGGSVDRDEHGRKQARCFQ